MRLLLSNCKEPSVMKNGAIGCALSSTRVGSLAPAMELIEAGPSKRMVASVVAVQEMSPRMRGSCHLALQLELKVLLTPSRFIRAHQGTRSCQAILHSVGGRCFGVVEVDKKATLSSPLAPAGNPQQSSSKALLEPPNTLCTRAPFARAVVLSKRGIVVAGSLDCASDTCKFWNTSKIVAVGS